MAKNAVRKLTRHSTIANKPRRKWTSIIAIIIVIAQLSWAVIIPIKNVAVIPYPVFKQDASESVTSAYKGYNSSTKAMTGKELEQLLHQVLKLSLTQPEIRRKFEQTGDFVIDDLAHIVSPKIHHIFAKYYSVVIEQSEFIGGVFTARDEDVVLVNSTSGERVQLSFSCKAGKNILNGMKCTTASGAPCDNKSFLQPYTLKFEPVDMKQFSNQTSLENNFGLLSLIDFFHQTMRQLFAKKDWKNAISAYMEPNLIQNAYGLHQNYTGSTKILTLPMDKFIGVNYKDFEKHGVKSFDACLPMEVTLGYIYIRSYVLKMIQDMLIMNNLYNPKDLVSFTPYMEGRMKVIFNNNFYTHSGAGDVRFRSKKRSLSGQTMTEIAFSEMILKQDRRMTGAMIFGSSLRHLWSMSRYPNSYYSYLKPSIRDNHIDLEFKHLGGYHAGFNGMKFDFVRNVMAVLRVSERTKLEDVENVDLFAEDLKFAKWYRDFEHASSQSFVLLAKKYFGSMDSASAREFQCYQGLMRKISQIAWLMALKLKSVINHIVYTSMDNGGNPYAWAKNQMLLKEIVGENPYGYRVHMQFVRTTVSTDTGNGWPIIPILAAFLKSYKKDFVVKKLLEEMNSTYINLIEFEGYYTQFKDVVFCPIGVDHLGVLETDNKRSMYNKIYPAFASLIQDIISSTIEIHKNMEQGVGAIQVRQEFVLHNRSHPIFIHEGAPVVYEQTALSIGIIKLMTLESPFENDLIQLKNSMVCYNTLELRYLNISRRCWAEPGTVVEDRRTWNSEGLRVVLFSTWSMGILLNIIGAGVALRFVHRMWSCGAVAGWWNISIQLAISLDIQGISVLSLSECAIMAFSSIPLILRYHLPADTEFLPRQKLQNDYFSEFIVALSLTWFTRLGIEIGNYFIHLNHFNVWFYYATTRLRHLFILLTMLLRLGIKVDIGDYDYGLWKLAISCAVTVIVGVLISCASLLFEQKPISKRRISAAFFKAGLPRNWYGTIGETSNGWDIFGLIFEGWEVLNCNDRYNLIKDNKVVMMQALDRKVITVEKISCTSFSSLSNSSFKSKWAIVPKID